MWQYLIKKLLAWLAGITADQWTEVLIWVRTVNDGMAGQTGAEKRAKVVEMMKQHSPELGAAALNLLIEAAVSYSKKL